MKLNQDFIRKTNSPEETLLFGEEIAKELESGDVLCLHGDLGAGKTHFVKGIARGLGVNETHVNSPTFTLINEYRGSFPIYHFDAYRINNDQEVVELGVDEYFYGDGICLIEWPEKMKNFLPENSVHITIQKDNESSRIFKFEHNGA
ncbi:MAG TPA: tRNA (adenosine(37)-N6)-threonylcarbamoyltransferase complex ATPase subunit type 1 TsaE [Bacteroidetes bacterium]|nr:tRNA (adenosine(37)-N6)-threonylcarbamoyltransferase complex ATPase subunit type 1 TsaE [Bacteroidota bacterium]